MNYCIVRQCLSTFYIEDHQDQRTLFWLHLLDSLCFAGKDYEEYIQVVIFTPITRDGMCIVTSTLLFLTSVGISEGKFNRT